MDEINLDELDYVIVEEDPLQQAYGQVEDYEKGQDIVASYEQYGHSISGPSFYTGGDKLMHTVQTSTYGKRAAFANKMPNDLRNTFGIESGLVNEYMELFSRLPRYWIRNPKLLIATMELGKHLNNGVLTQKALAQVAQSQDVLATDLYRYYKLFKGANLL